MPRRGGPGRLACCCTAALAALLVLSGCSDAGRRPNAGDELRIGLLAPLTGSPMRYTANRAAQALVDRVNAAGGLDLGGRRIPVRLFVEDTAGRIETAMAAAARLMGQDGVQALVGPYFSREAIPVAAAAEAAQVLLLTPSATSPEITRGRRFIFRACMLDSAQGQALARFAYADLGLRRAAVLYDESDDYSSGLARYFGEALRGQDGARVLAVSYSRGTADFSAALAEIKAFGAQALLLPNFIEDLSRQVVQARAAGFRGVFLGGDSWDSDRGLHSLPEAQGARFSVEYAAAAAAPEARSAAEELARTSGAQLDKNTALTLDSLELLFAAARRTGAVDSASLRSGLLALRDFNGLTGAIRFASGGDPARSLHIMRIRGGELGPVKDIAPER
jgi:branched-chain amino acid transport system substrate-binding protein